jgi:thioredoxin 1
VDSRHFGGFHGGQFFSLIETNSRRNSMTKEFTTQSWEKDVLSSAKPVLVDFWAPWCGPCRTQGPIVDTLASEVGDTAIIGKLNVDENPETAGQYGVQSIPTIAIFKSGKIVQKFVGVTGADKLKEALASANG